MHGFLDHLRVARDGCVYCGGRPATVEHAVPKWIDKIAGGDGYIVLGLGFNRRAAITATAVCVPCGGWMNETFEYPAQRVLPPLIHGRSGVLGPGDQSVVAAWAYKTALMVALAGEPDAPEPSEYKTFRETELLPDAVAVHVGVALPAEFAAQVEAPYWAKFGEDGDLPPYPPIPRGVRRVIGVGMLLLIVDWGTPEWVQWLCDGPRQAFPRVWPPTGRVVAWPTRGRQRTSGGVHYQRPPVEEPGTG